MKVITILKSTVPATNPTGEGDSKTRPRYRVFEGEWDGSAPTCKATGKFVKACTIAFTQAKKIDGVVKMVETEMEIPDQVSDEQPVSAE